MKTLEDLKLCKKSHAKVEAWLNELLDVMIRNADGREGNVYRADFEGKDFFYFTDCRDLVSKEVESTGQEVNRKIVVRKRYVMNQLLLKAMLGKLKLLKIKCSHCGHDNVYIDSCEGGYFKWCPKCYKTDISVFPDSYNKCIKSIRDKLAQKAIRDEKPCNSTPRFDNKHEHMLKPDPRLKDIITKRRKND